ncbi:MAG: four helix bundle protein, partial [Rhodothermales bacterium]
MSPEDLIVYQRAMELAETIWNLVISWPPFMKDTIGKQWIRAADSIAANLSEGFGRYHFRENRQFCYYARGSLQETATWLQKAIHRKLVEPEQGDALARCITSLGKQLNQYIN